MPKKGALAGQSSGGKPRPFRARQLLRAYLAFLVLVAPMKLGSVVQAGEISFFPSSVWEVVFGIWPSWWMPPLTGLALVATAVLRPGFGRLSWAWLVPGAWGLLWLVGLVGLFRTTEWDTALLFVWHLLGVFCFVLALFWAIQDDPALLRWLLVALAVASVWSCFNGWQQVPLGGLEETERLVSEQVQSGQMPMQNGLQSRLVQRRAYGTFVYPNSYAAHLLLVSPLLLCLLWRAGRRFEPAGLSQFLFAGLGGGLGLGALAFSGSRAAVVALGGGLVFGLFRAPSLRRFRLPLGIACLVVAVALFGAVNAGRGVSSLTARADYWRAALEMVREHPVTGVGWGEFFPHYMRLKSASAEETRQPHCSILAFASQAGLGAALMLFFCFLLPLTARPALQKAGLEVDPVRFLCVEVGLVAWQLHSLADFDIQIPGTLMMVAALPLLGLAGGRHTPGEVGAGWRRVGAGALGVLALAGLWRIPGERAYQRLSMEANRGLVSLQSLNEQAEKTSARLPSPYPWWIVGRAAEQRRDWALAAEAYGKAAQRSPHRASFHARQAGSLISLGRLEEARAALGKALVWYPANLKYREMAEQLGMPAGP